MSRFLFSTMPIPGHVAPIAPVARTLIERGHDVIWYGSKYHADAIVRSGASFRPIRSTVDYGDGEYDKLFSGRRNLNGLRKVVFDFEHFFVNATPGYLTDLRAISGDFHPDAIVHDLAVAAGVIMGIKDGLPAATVNISVLAIEGRNVGPFGLGLLPTDGPLGRLRNRAMFSLVDHVIFGRVNWRTAGWPLSTTGRSSPSDRGPATLCTYSHPWRPSSTHARICRRRSTSSGHCFPQSQMTSARRRGGVLSRKRDQREFRSSSSLRAPWLRTPRS
jgi:hypothetical protein